MDYWAGLSSSRGGDASRRYAYALWRGGHTVNRHLAARVEQNLTEWSVSPSWDDEVADEWKWARMNLPIPTEPGVEEQLGEAAERLRVERLVDSIPTEEWDNWLGDYLEGLSIRRAARRQGVSHVAILKRREAGMERLRRHFGAEQ